MSDESKRDVGEPFAEAHGSEIEIELIQRRAIEPGQIRTLLHRHGLISPDALKDPNDNYATWDNVNSFVRELRESLFPNDSIYPTRGDS